MKNKGWLVFVMSSLTLFLSVGMFVGACHEFEELWGETPDVWTIENPAFSSNQFPLAILVPFGWSSDRTILQMCTFWFGLALGCALHYIKWSRTQWVIQTYGEDNIMEETNKSHEEAEAGKSTPYAMESHPDAFVDKEEGGI